MSKFMVGAKFVVGGLVGWVLSPSLWSILPGRWISLLLATARAESNFIENASGDDGASVGVAQFKADTWLAVSPDGYGSSARTDPYASGRKAAGMVATAFEENPLVWWVALTLLPGPWYMRALWRGGWGDSTSRSWSKVGELVTETKTAETGEGTQQTGMWYWGSRLFTLPLDVLVILGFAAAIRRLWAKR